MSRNARFLAAAVLGCAALLALSAWLHSWGGITLILLGAGAMAWYRAQVARGEATEQFFGDMGEETRLTGLQGGASELPMDHRTLPGRARPPEVR